MSDRYPFPASQSQAPLSSAYEAETRPHGDRQWPGHPVPRPPRPKDETATMDPELFVSPARLMVVGVGGAGCNAVDRMIEAGHAGVEFVAVNTDLQDLSRNRASRRIQIGAKLTKGLGAGGRPEVGAKAAEESREELAEVVAGWDMVFVAAGMGGGTGTGAAPLIAELARDADALTVAVVTKPFGFEGPRRMAQAEQGITALADRVDSLIVIPNDRLMSLGDKRMTFEQAFRTADEVLQHGIQSISELITQKAMLNLDFADARRVMKDGGAALMSVGYGSGENRASEAAERAIACPLLDVTIEGAKGVLLNVTGGPDLTLAEVAEAAEVIRRTADPDADVYFGAAIEPEMGDSIRITVIATGLRAAHGRRLEPEPQIVVPRRRIIPLAVEPESDLPVFLRQHRTASP